MSNYDALLIICNYSNVTAKLYAWLAVSPPWFKWVSASMDAGQPE